MTDNKGKAEKQKYPVKEKLPQKNRRQIHCERCGAKYISQILLSKKVRMEFFFFKI